MRYCGGSNCREQLPPLGLVDQREEVTVFKTQTEGTHGNRALRRGPAWLWLLSPAVGGVMKSIL